MIDDTTPSNVQHNAAERVAERLADALNMVLGKEWAPKVDGMAGGTWRVGAHHGGAGVMVTMRALTGQATIELAMRENEYEYHATYDRRRDSFKARGDTPIDAILALKSMLAAEVAKLTEQLDEFKECLPEELR